MHVLLLDPWTWKRVTQQTGMWPLIDHDNFSYRGSVYRMKES